MAVTAVYSMATVLLDAATTVWSWAHVVVFLPFSLSCSHLTKGGYIG